MVSGVTASSVSFSDAAANLSVSTEAGSSTSNNAAAGNVSSASTVLPNPQAQFDPSLNLVVLEFHSSSGEIVRSIPSQSQLNAYQLNMPSTGAASTATV